jgi:hypothetical protein
VSRLGGRFVLEREIGSGGMAQVFLGRDEVLDRPVAVKVLRGGFGGTEIAHRFQREGRTAARLSHPNIVQVYDAGEGELHGREVSYIVMEYVPGGDLKDLVRERGPVPGPELSKLGAGVAAGLAHAHERGVIHRDIKPHNILLDGRGQPKLTDFGIARALDASGVTRTGSYLGTAMYSSPEQLQGERVTPKSDVYSLGATLYEAATGEPPFSGGQIEVASQHVSKSPRPPGELNGTVGEELEALILACLDKDPDSRPTAEELRERLAAVGETGGRARAYAAPPPDREARTAPIGAAVPRRRRTGRTAVVLAIPVLLLIGALGLLALLREDPDEVAPATTSEPVAQPAAPAPRPAPEQPVQPAPEPQPVRPAPEQTTPQQPQPEVTQGARDGLSGEMAGGGSTAQDNRAGQILEIAVV